MNKKGISLIILIITIIVIIILAAAVILTITKNNPIESAKEAVFKEDVRKLQDDLAMTISKEYTKNGGQRDYKITSNSDEIKEYIIGYTDKYKGKFRILNDELVGTYKLTQKEKSWASELGIRVLDGLIASDISDEPKKYYGKNVSYVPINNSTKNWKIFYADSNNVYIISDNYILVDMLPENSAGHRPQKGSYERAATFNAIIGDYSGSNDITNLTLKSLNNDYFSKNYISYNNNMKAVAYMLDINTWSVFKDENLKADYAIGGPTLEMFIKSYTSTHNKDYCFEAKSEIGYQVSKDGGKNWGNYYYNFLDSNSYNNLYVVSSSKMQAYGMWLASPSYCDKNKVFHTGDQRKDINTSTYNNLYIGFRPVVCIKSNVIFKENSSGVFELE